MGLSITAFSRPYENEYALITVALTNQEVGGKDEACLFQSRFRASLTGPGHVLPYPKRSGSDGSGNDREEAGSTSCTENIGPSLLATGALQTGRRPTAERRAGSPRNHSRRWKHQVLRP